MSSSSTADPFSSMQISVIIPVYNEGESLPQLQGEIEKTAAANGYDLQIIYVDDGSTDSTWSTIERITRANAQVEAVRFRRNFGKSAALAAGDSGTLRLGGDD